MAGDIAAGKQHGDDHESHAREAGRHFAEGILPLMSNWQGPATILAIAGYVASKNGMPIGKTQLSVGLGMITAGAVAEAISIRHQNPEIDIKSFNRKIVKSWLQKIQAPSNVSLIAGMVGMLKKIKGSEAAFIAGAIGTVLNIAPEIIARF